MTQQPAEDRVETEERGWSPWNVGSLAAAVALFLLGVGGLLAVFPYSEPVGFNALFVTSPSVTPAAKPAVAVKSATGEPASPEAASSFSPDPTIGEMVTSSATEEPTEAAASPPAVFAASQDQAPVATVADLPDPTATPTTEPDPTATPTQQPTVAVPTPTPTEEPTPEPTASVDDGEKPAPGEHPRSDPKKPVTAFIDDTNTGAQSNNRDGGVSTPAQAVPPPPTN
jgi:hypothetical protein